VPIKDLAESLHMDRATIRTALNLLVKRGYVERQLMRQRGRHQYEYRLIFQKN
jgi:predicted transcriptional regulator